MKNNLSVPGVFRGFNYASNRNKVLEWAVFLLILALGAYFRFVSLRANPGWYSDEGVFIDFSSHLSRGQWQIFGALNAPLLIQRPPLFLLILAGVFKLFGADILILRSLTAFYGLVAVALVYLLGRRMFGSRLALLSAFVMAVQPTIVAYNRIGLTYNQLMPLLLLTIFACWTWRQQRKPGWAIAACAFAALAFATDFLGILAPILVALVFLVTDWRWFLGGVALMAVLFLALFSPFYLASPQNFSLALNSIFSTRVAASPLSQVVNALLSYGELLRRESWIALGLIGLFLLPDRRSRALMVTAAGLGILLVVRNQTPVGRGLHYLMGLFPLFAVGLAALIYRAFPLVAHFLEELFERAGQGLGNLHRPQWVSQGWRVLSKVITALVIFSLLVAPLVWMAFADVAQSVSGSYFIFTGNDDLSLTPEQDVMQVVDYFRQNASPDDLVVASPQIAWAVPAFGVDYGTLDIYENSAGQYPYPRTIFSRPITLDEATYAILDPLARDFAPMVLPGMDEIIKKVEGWEMVYEVGAIEVFRNAK